MPEHPLRILLVEDHTATASALARTLQRQGFAVASASSARAALEAAATQTFDLLITDIGLPEKNGWELFGELRKLQPRIVAIALTGYGYPADMRRSEAAGIAIHLTKPTTMQHLQSAIVKLFPKQAAAFTDAQGRPKPL